MKVKFFYLLVLFAVLTMYACMSGGSAKNADFDKTMITVESIVFGSDGRMTVNDENGNIIAYYERFSSEGSRVKGVKVYDRDGKLAYTIVPAEEKDNMSIHIKGSEDRIGRVTVQRTSKVWGMEFKRDINFFGKLFDPEMTVTYENEGIRVNNLILLDNMPVMAQNEILLYKGSGRNIIAARKDYFNDNQKETALWALSLMILNEMNLEEGRSVFSANERQRSSGPHHTFESINSSIMNTMNR